LICFVGDRYLTGYRILKDNRAVLTIVIINYEFQFSNKKMLYLNSRTVIVSGIEYGFTGICIFFWVYPTSYSAGYLAILDIRVVLLSVLWIRIRIRMDPELFVESGSGTRGFGSETRGFGSGCGSEYKTGWKNA
jgi:hypothetical protein